MDSGGDAPAVVLYGDGVVFMYRDLDILTIAGECLVDGVVHHLIYQVVQALDPDVSNIHRRPLPDGFQAFQHLDTVGTVASLALCLFFVDLSRHISVFPAL